MDAAALLAEVSSPAPVFETCPTMAPRDAECRRLRGAPEDVHTPEGAARGYEFRRRCPSYAPWGDVVVAVIGTGRWEMPDFSRSAREGREKEFWILADAVRRAAGVSSIHARSAYMRCSERAPFTVVLHMHDWTQVDAAVRNLGTWLAAHDLGGEVILWLQGIAGPPVPL
jgi:hypothetical protein